MSNSDSRAGRIFDDESLTDELTDDEAKFLLKWGERQVFALSRGGMGGEAFDEATHQLRRLMRQINRLTGQRSGMDVEGQRAVLNEVVGQARALGFEAPDWQAEHFLYIQHTLDNAECLRVLTTLVAPPSV
jgi:hypothetical protein